MKPKKPTFEQLKAKVESKGCTLLVGERSVAILLDGEQVAKAWTMGKSVYTPEKMCRQLHGLINSMGWRVRV